ncbi:fasciclin domain-containing protein [Brevundimonas basaltis]|uniref:Putative surface protein with fasciclin (FAS1) repeats n=1 Tax=Brevundimonas basaltis TaxID=472166 RepID=A0A7W8HYE2_9CAUL|nr:fasciclin domain-containing protein [Brevundimonas basaltis]MBB5292177.1 putative surface protein with fasciclin (FAS1) repeats [Brevundimonas basaltis]
MTSTRSVLAVVAALAMLSACDSDASRKSEPPPSTAPAPVPAATETVLAVAERDPDFTTLVAALQTAGLAETLNGGGPFTIFAPTNAAFEKIPTARRDALTRPEGQAELRRLLTYHVVPARLDAAGLVQRIQAADGSLALTTMQGGALTARMRADGAIELTDAAGSVSRLVEADMAASNGVIHAVDTVAAPG